MGFKPAMEEEKQAPHPSRNRENWFPQDQLLRHHHYKIHSREKGKEALWTASDGSIVPHSEAVSLIARKAAEKTCKGR